MKLIGGLICGCYSYCHECKNLISDCASIRAYLHDDIGIAKNKRPTDYPWAEYYDILYFPGSDAAQRAKEKLAKQKFKIEEGKRYYDNWKRTN